MFPTSRMPSFSITRNEATFVASAPATTRSIPASLRAWHSQLWMPRWRSIRPCSPRKLVGKLRLLHTFEPDKTTKSDDVFATVPSYAEQADALFGEHPNAP